VADDMAHPERPARARSPRRRGVRYIADDIAEQIRRGRLTAGAKLPTYFALAEIYDVSLSTVQRAIGLLNARGLVRGTRGDGVYVADPDRTRS
jgi:GntR family transcriptional regulator